MRRGSVPMHGELAMVTLSPYELLGVRPTSTDAEVLAAYEHLFEVFDPRRWADDPSLLEQVAWWAEELDQARRMLLGR